MLSQRLERPNPSIKAVNLNLREKTENLLQQFDVYEILLIDQTGMITEGSKSNVFFIRNNMVFTPPEHCVLPGITRKYVFSICKKLSIEIIEKNIYFESVTNYEAVFITGTSPKILPVKQIDNTTFRVDNRILHQIITEFEEIILKNITTA